MTAARTRSERAAGDSEAYSYLASEGHCARLAKRLGRHLAASAGNVLLTGLPSRDFDRLLVLLRREAGESFRLAAVDCTAGTGLADLIAAIGRTLALPAPERLQSWTLLSRLMTEARGGRRMVLLLANPEHLGEAEFD